MAYKNKGNALTKPELQAGYTIENDGYGLLTSRLAYRIDQTRVESNAPKKGDPHPKDSRLTAWKVMWTRDQNDFATIQADYIGFAQGDSTTPIVSGVGVTQQEAIDTHISFENAIGGTPAAPINGCTFDGAGKFTGFPHSAATKAAGTVNLRAYLAPTLGFSGIVYVKNFQTVQTVVDQIGKTSKSGMFAGLQLVYKKDAEWVIGSPGGASGNWDQLFLDSVNYEEFGLIYKINYSVRYFAYGFNPLVYSKASN
jgi:hypothetical protein